MRKLSLLSLTALTSVMMAGVPALSSQASVYSLRVPSGMSGNSGNCQTTSNSNASQNCDNGQSLSKVLNGLSGGNNQNCNSNQNSNGNQNSGSPDCSTGQTGFGGQNDCATAPDFSGGGQVQFFKGEIIRQSLPTGEESKPSLPGGNENKPSLPGEDTNKPSQPGEDTNKPSQPGEDTNKPSQPGGDVNKPSQPGEDVNKPETPDESNYAEEILALVNAERAKAGVGALTLDDTAVEAANVRAEETKKSFSHTRPDGRDFSTALTDAGIRYTASGENIAYGQNSPEEVMRGWMNSAGHRANILNKNFTSIGIGHFETASGVDYWTQLFFR